MISEFPLFMFTTFDGLAAGAYVAGALFPLGKGSKRPWAFPLACLVLLAIGMIFLPFHLQHPERMLNALTHPSTMIAQEAYWSVAFGAIMLVDLILARVKGAALHSLRIIGAICGFVLTIIMANAYFVSYGVPAWSSWQTFLLYVVGDLAMGFALYAVFDRALFKRGAYFIVSAVLSGLAMVAFALEGAHFADVGLSVVPFVVSVVLAAVGALFQLLTKQGKFSERAGIWMALICLFMAVVVARYAFYSAF